MISMAENPDWKEYSLDVAIYQSIRLFNRNSPLIDNLSRIFQQLSQTLKQVYGYRCALHGFINQTLPEAHVLYEKKDPPAYQLLSFKDHLADYDELLDIFRRRGWLFRDEGTPLILKLSGDTLQKVLQSLDVSPLPSSDTDGIFISFDSGRLNLGWFILYGERKGKEDTSISDPGMMSGRISSLYKNYSSYLDKEYQLISENRSDDGVMITKKTYLPSFRSARWTQVAILFADIHNFTPFTEILRNIDLPTRSGRSSLQIILNDYFENMVGVIQQHQGRIERFFGAGILAVFGEHDDNPALSARSAVMAAQDMVRCFRDLKEKIYKTGFGDQYKYEFNENVEIFLGVGIDYGTVLFDYLGDERHREYSMVGDHVNFARMLGYEACRFNPRDNRRRPPVLLSRTVYHCIASLLARHDLNTVEIQPQDRNYPYSVFGADEDLKFK